MALWRWQHAPDSGQPRRQDHLSPARFSDLTGWRDDDHAGALTAFAASSDSSDMFKYLGGIARAWPHEPRVFFEGYFRPYRVLSGASQPLLTGYFEPELKGARHPTDEFRHPVYRLPADLELIEAGQPSDARAQGLTAGRRVNGGFAAYHTRAEIEEGALSGLGLEIAWVADPVDLYVMHVQGSGLIVSDAGSLRLTFAGKNGHPYTSIGKRLIEIGQFDAGSASLDQVLQWIRANPKQGRALMRENKSYIFFDILPDPLASQGPRGSLGVPLVAGRSLAVDPNFHPPGAPLWVEAAGLRSGGIGFPRLMIAHDTGSAIRGPVRGDVFYGSGAAAGRAAGRTKQACHFFALLPLMPARDERRGD